MRLNNLTIVKGKMTGAHTATLLQSLPRDSHDVLDWLPGYT